ncbi:MAG: 4-alpha-glucanotransferase [Coraliomargarita sp.]
MTQEPNKPLFDRDCGVLLHPSSLPNPYEIGDFGPAALRWIDQLREHQQNLWQVLPLHPCGYGNSPYQALSAFAGNPLFLSPQDLQQRGLLSPGELRSLLVPLSGSVDYTKAYRSKAWLSACVASRFFGSDGRDAALHRRYSQFLDSASWWLEDYALYATLKALHGGQSWTDWAEPFRDRDPAALEQVAYEHQAQMNRVCLEQFLLREQWRKVRKHANACGVRIIGDLPIFVAHDSADVWCRPDLFRLDRQGRPLVVAGVPPDYFSETGQLWGNPLYDWPVHQAESFSWWRRRIGEVLNWVDIVRIDHFRGFSACWEVPAEAQTAVDGHWVDVPGEDLFACIAEDLGWPLPFIAEDLGVITPDVRRLQERFGLPGIRIEQFAFGNDALKHTFLPGAYDSNCVAYTGTHDNDTVQGWFGKQPGVNCTMSWEEIESERAEALAYFGTDGSRLHWDFIHSLYSSDAGAAIVPLQDVLGLGSEARMNVPGAASGNWAWRVSQANAACLGDALYQLSDISTRSHRGLARSGGGSKRPAAMNLQTKAT